jgi:hypothetical protein
MCRISMPNTLLFKLGCWHFSDKNMGHNFGSLFHSLTGIAVVGFGLNSVKKNYGTYVDCCGF